MYLIHQQDVNTFGYGHTDLQPADERRCYSDYKFAPTNETAAPIRVQQNGELHLSMQSLLEALQNTIISLFDY